jgi:16S rRNA (guanine527-N7)-methyltransferase
MNEQQFIENLKIKGINITADQMELFKKYYEILVDYNQKVNLTSITNQEEVYLKHFYDSLSVLTLHPLKEGSSLCDVGAGAGFPSVPIKIIRPDLKITIVDSLGKRIQFLDYLFGELKLSNINAVNARAEEFTVDHRESFDYVTARAVARLNVLAELCIPLAKVGGEFIALKAASGEEELLEAKNALNKLGCQLKDQFQFELPYEGGMRNILIFDKVNHTPNQFPRNYGQIKKKPL